MATSHMTVRGAGYNKTKANFPAVNIGVVGSTGFRGTAALPSYTWEEDATTGIYSSAASAIDFATAGVRVGGFDTAGLSNTQFGATANFAIWYPSWLFPSISFTTGTWTATRIAAADYSMRHTAAAQTSTLEFPLMHDMTRIAASRGFRPTGVRDIEQIVTAALTTNTPDTAQVVYANNTANATTTTAAFGTITGTAPTATQTNPYVTNLTFGTTIFLANLTGYYYTKSVVFAGTTAYDYYGFFLNGTLVV